MPILVVEDDIDIADTLSAILDDLGFPTVVARDGVDAVERARAVPPPAAILLDMTLPRLSGDEVVQRLQADEALRTIPVITMTGLSHVDRVPGTAAHLPKPFDFDDLVAALRAAAVLD